MPEYSSNNYPHIVRLTSSVHRMMIISIRTEKPGYTADMRLRKIGPTGGWVTRYLNMAEFLENQSSIHEDAIVLKQPEIKSRLLKEIDNAGNPVIQGKDREVR
jgi:hypothetical protein